LNAAEAQRKHWELQQQKAAANAVKYQAYQQRLAEKREARRAKIRAEMLARR